MLSSPLMVSPIDVLEGLIRFPVRRVSQQMRSPLPAYGHPQQPHLSPGEHGGWKKQVGACPLVKRSDTRKDVGVLGARETWPNRASSQLHSCFFISSISLFYFGDFSSSSLILYSTSPSTCLSFSALLFPPYNRSVPASHSFAVGVWATVPVAFLSSTGRIAEAASPESGRSASLSSSLWSSSPLTGFLSSAHTSILYRSYFSLILRSLQYSLYSFSAIGISRGNVPSS